MGMVHLDVPCGIMPVIAKRFRANSTPWQPKATRIATINAKPIFAPPWGLARRCHGKREREVVQKRSQRHCSHTALSGRDHGEHLSEPILRLRLECYQFFGARGCSRSRSGGVLCLSATSGLLGGNERLVPGLLTASSMTPLALEHSKIALVIRATGFTFECMVMSTSRMAQAVDASEGLPEFEDSIRASD